MSKLKEAVSKISKTTDLAKMIDKGGVHFTTEKGLHSPEQIIKIKDAIKQLRKEGIPVQTVGGMYEGKKELSAFVPTNDEKIINRIKELAEKTGQDSILVTSPTESGKLKSDFVYTAGPRKGEVQPLNEGIGGFRLSEKQPEHEYWSKFNTEQGPRYLEYGTGDVPMKHYGKPDLNELDVSKMRSGADYRKEKYDNKVGFLYGVHDTPEDVVKAHNPQEYYSYANPDKFYNLEKDFEGIVKQAGQDMPMGNYKGNPADRRDLALGRVKEAGYEGSYRQMVGDTPDSKPRDIYETNVNRPLLKIADSPRQSNSNIFTDTLKEKAKGLLSGSSNVVQKIAEKLNQINEETGINETNRNIKNKLESGLRNSPQALDSFINNFNLKPQSALTPDEIDARREQSKKAAKGSEFYDEHISPAVQFGADWVLPDASNLLGPAGKVAKIGAKELKIASKIKAANAAEKLEKAMQAGYKPTAAEMHAYSKFKNVPTVIPEPVPKKPIILGDTSKPADFGAVGADLTELNKKKKLSEPPY